MSRHHETPPGFCDERTIPIPAPIDNDRGFLVHSIAELLRPDDEPQLTVVGGLAIVHEAANTSVDTSVAIPSGAAEEVLRAHIDGLPAKEFWLEQPRDYRIVPRQTDKGLVDDKALIADVQATISPEYVWPGKPDRHHLYWPRADYVTAHNLNPKAYLFREHGSNVIRVQRVFHNWIHAISEIPPMPDPEVMQYTLRAWEVVGDFFGAVRQTVNHQRLFGREEARRGGYSDDQKEMIRDIMLRELGGIIMHLDALQTIPEDYWPFRPDIRIQIAAGRVGQVLTKGYLNRTREVRLASVA